MTTSHSSVSRTVMRRVRTIHALRPFFSTATLASLLFLLAVWGIGREVWVAHVLQNMPSMQNVTSVARFFASAFMSTRFIVQVLAVVAVAAFVWAAREITRVFPGVGQVA